MYSYQQLLDIFEKERDHRIILMGSEEKYELELKELRIKAHEESISKLNRLADKFKECEENG